MAQEGLLGGKQTSPYSKLRKVAPMGDGTGLHTHQGGTSQGRSWEPNHKPGTF